jgi:type IV secretion system protein VirD4
MSDFDEELESDLARGVEGQEGNLTDAKWLDPAALMAPQWNHRDAKGQVAGLLLGYREGRFVGWRDDRHVMTVAGARGGKGVSLICPNLLSYDGSVIVIDPKGELARITSRARREKGQKVVILDPFGENGAYPSGAFNPLAELDPEGPHVTDDAGQIADALIVPSEKEPHWTDSARILVKALILWALTRPMEERNLITVWQLLATTHKDVRLIAERGNAGTRTALFALLKKTTGVFGDTISGTGDRFLETSEKELASIFSTALSQLEFLDSKAMANVLTGNDLKLSELKTGRATLYLCLPSMRMGTHARWLRVIINMALVAIEREKCKVDIPILMLLDEFPILGHMKSIEKAAGLMAGFGVKLWTVVQDLSQLEQHYNKSWQTFIGNAGLVTIFANTDKRTLEYFSEKLGQTTVRVRQPSGATVAQRMGGASGMREELRVQRLAAANELELLLARDRGRVLVMGAGYDPVILKRIVYYQDKPFAGRFDA